jgi:hypothetical protein
MGDMHQYANNMQTMLQDRCRLIRADLNVMAAVN